MTVADLVAQARAAGLDAESIADLIAVEAPRLAARIERIYRVSENENRAIAAIKAASGLPVVVVADDATRERLLGLLPYNTAKALLITSAQLAELELVEVSQ